MNQLRDYQTEPREHYVYVHVRPDTNSVFYVGKGKGLRAYHHYNRNKHWQNVVSKNNGLFHVRKVFEALTESEAASKEIELIALYGIDNLCNVTHGGEGKSGWKTSDEVKRKLSVANTGKVRSLETRLKISKIVTGTKKGPRPEAVKDKISKANSGCKNGMYGKLLPLASRMLQAKKISGDNHYLAKPIINLNTGIFYPTINDAAFVIDMKRGTLWSMISGKRRNKTSFVYA